MKCRRATLSFATVALVAIVAMFAGTTLAFADQDAAPDSVDMYTIYLEVGEGHNDVADTVRKQLKKSLSLEAAPESSTIAQIDVPSTYTVGDVIELFSGVADYWKGIVDDEGIEDEEEQSGEKCAGKIGLKPMLEYANAQAYESEMQAKSNDAIENGQTFYLFWYKPISNLELTVDQPIEGTTVTMADAVEGATPEQTPSPNVALEGSAHLAPEFTGGHGGYWLANVPMGFNRDPEPFAGTILPNTNYFVVSYLRADYGYYFDQLTTQKIMINGKRQKKVDAIMSGDEEILLVFGELQTVNAPSELLTITEQPEDATVAYPDPVQFHVAVDHPELVKSYEWMVSVESEREDGSFEYMDFSLDGSSAKTDTLTMPSTDSDYHRWLISCTITDIEGKTVTTRQAIRKISNPAERKHVLYIDEYAILPGESFDLAEKGLGTGTATFDADGHNITFDSFKFCNANQSVFDSTICGTTGVFLYFPKQSPDEAGEYHLHFNGNSVIDNQYYDASSNAGGVTLNCFFATTDYPNSPALIIDGDSPLTLKGGQFALRNDGELEIATDINVESFDNNYCDAIRARSIYVNEGVKLNLNCCGAGLIAAKGDIFIYNGAEVNIDSLMPRISNGSLVKSLIRADGNINLQGTKITAAAHTVPGKSKITNLTGIEFGGILRCDNTAIDIKLDAQESGSTYASNFNGITGDGLWSSIEMTNGSSISIGFDEPEVFGAAGIILARNLDMQKDCTVAVDIAAQARVVGLFAENELLMDGDGASLDVNVKSYSTDEEKRPFGIVCEKLSVTNPGSTTQIHSRVEDGPALIAGATEEVEEYASYNSAYVPTRVVLDKACAISLPRDGVISSYNYKNPFYISAILAGESIYDPSNTSAPAQEVRIDVTESASPSPSTTPTKKLNNTLTAKGKTIKLKAKKVKGKKIVAKKKTLKRTKAFKISGANGALSFKKIKGNPKITVAKKTGKVTIKKGLKKGTYKVRVRVTAAGDAKHKKKSTIAIVTVRVRSS